MLARCAPTAEPSDADAASLVRTPSSGWLALATFSLGGEKVCFRLASILSLLPLREKVASRASERSDEGQAPPSVLLDRASGGFQGGDGVGDLGLGQGPAMQA